VPLCDVADEIVRGDLIHVLPDCILPDLEVFAVFADGVTRSAKIQSLLEFMRREMRGIDIGRSAG